MMRSPWEVVPFDSNTIQTVDLLQSRINLFGIQHKSSSRGRKNLQFTVASPEDDVVDTTEILKAESPAGEIDIFKEVLQEANECCSEALINLDSLLTTLDEIKDEYYAITGRTNMLMSKCESLLEEQRTLQHTVEQLREIIKPFQDIEEVASTLGIPFEGGNNGPNAQSNSYSLDSIGSNNIDPRSPEFQELLNKLFKAYEFLTQHPEIKDTHKYHLWLEKLQIRATSLIGRSMRDLLDRANKQCKDAIQQKQNFQKNQISQPSAGHSNPNVTSNNHSNMLGSKFIPEEQPLESLPIYSKFRSLAYRMRELLLVLFQHAPHASDDPTANFTDLSTISRSGTFDDQDSGRRTGVNQHKVLHDQMILQEVKKGYSVIRMELLPIYLQEVFFVALQHSTSLSPVSDTNFNISDNTSPPNSTTHMSLSAAIRYTFTSLLRISQLEYQLFDLLFNLQHSPPQLSMEALNNRSMSMDILQPTASNNQLSFNSALFIDLLRIIDMVLHNAHDFLRPLIIRESSIDELCRIISALSEDIQCQISIFALPPAIIGTLSKGLENILNDTKERLIYIAELTLRKEIIMFEPLPSQLAYPDILEQHVTFKNSVLGSGNSESVENVSSDVFNTWYPPMRLTLSLLSKLYHIVEMPIFEDFATRSLSYCLNSLQSAAEQIKKRQLPIHGDLFLIRHLLILREQLIPFEIKLLNVEKSLDFKRTNQVIQEFLQQTTSNNSSGRMSGGSDYTNDRHQNSVTHDSSISAITRNLLRFDSQNILVQFAQQGIPSMKESQQDMKKELDVLLKKASTSLKSQAMKLLLHSLDQWIVKVVAFVGEIPVEFATVQFSQNSVAENGKRTEAFAAIKNQAFVKPDRIKEMLEQSQALLVSKLPDFLDMMKLYVENPVTRNILLKSIIQEYELTRKKLECIVSNCVDSSSSLHRDIDRLLNSISHSIVAELTVSSAANLPK